MLDLVVDLISNMLDNWSSGNMDSSWGSNMVSSRGSISIGGSRNNSWGSSLHFNSLYLSNSWGSNQRGSMVSNWSSMVGNWSSNSNNWGSMGNWVNKAILINILRESLKGKRSVSTVGSNKVTNQRVRGPAAEPLLMYGLAKRRA
eukprot:TRINITY_DN769_c0_g1_i6.p1 TRINITY_DN769_c0_g1~~TRINITY_DN769_c0_g1_i6.p1  ORF type:complete len:145 (+),score=45.06 TRINITY_DN769_c0_g1_i6:117-551(+)